MMLWSELAIILALTVLNGVFTGAEIAMLSVRKTRLESLAGEGSSAARSALHLRRAPEALLATIQIGITVIGATTAVFGGSRLEAPLAGVLAKVGLGDAAPGVAFVLVIVLVSYLSLVIGELVPKSMALRAPERFALMIAKPLVGLSAVSRPLVWFLTASSNVVLRPFRDQTTFSESRLSPDELQQLLEESALSGALDSVAGEMASRAIDLGRLKANALMTPRRKIVSLDVGASDAKVLQVLRDSPHTRYPVHEEHPEQVIGYVLSRDVFEALLARKLSLRALLRPIKFFPEARPAVEVLRALQAEKQQIALLVEEQGGLAGLITIEDIAEDLLGEILEEHEVLRPLAWREPDESIVALGEAPIHEVARLLGEPLSAAGGATSLAGLVMERASGVPEAGASFQLAPRVRVEVLEASARAIGKLRLQRIPLEPETGDTDRDSSG